MSDYIKEKVEEFNKLFCDIYPGDSGLGGNDPQEPVDDWACYPSDVRKWLKNSLQEMEERTREELREKIVDLPKMYWGLAGESPTPRYVSFDDVLFLLSHKKDTGEVVNKDLKVVNKVVKSGEKECTCPEVSKFGHTADCPAYGTTKSPKKEEE